MKDHRDLPAFQSSHELVLVVHEAVQQLPGLDRSALGARMEAAAHSAAAAVARACAVPGEQFSTQMDEASRRLREVGYYIDIAQRLGHLDLDLAVELLERQTRAGVEVNALLQGEGNGGAAVALPWDGEGDPEPVGSGLGRGATFPSVQGR
jgi:four helix bundle protein